MLLAAVMTANRTWGNTEEQIFDRSYRLKYNKGQVLMDRVCEACNVGCRNLHLLIINHAGFLCWCDRRWTCWWTIFSS